MAEPVNLNKARKAKAKAKARAVANSNAAKHGRSRHETLLGEARRDKAKQDLDQLKRE